MSIENRISKPIIENKYLAEDIIKKIVSCSNLGDSLEREWIEKINDGGFLMKIINKELILIRYTKGQREFTKNDPGLDTIDMKSAAFESVKEDPKNNGVVHTSAALNFGFFTSWVRERYPFYGIFRIPLSSIDELLQNGKMSAGNPEEFEIMLSSDMARKFADTNFRLKPSNDFDSILAI